MTVSGVEEKLFSVLVVPKKATHVIVHGTDERGRLGPKLSVEYEGRVFDYWPLSEVSRSWVVSTFGPGTYRFAFLGVNAAGRREKLGTSGSVVFEEDAPRPAAPPPPPPPDTTALLAEHAAAREIGRSSCRERVLTVV